MDNNAVQLVGGPCGQHGPYTFYKAFRYTKNGVKRIMTLSEFFFVKLWIDSDLVCIGELQLLWMDKNSDQVLSSLRLYFLPENTPEGRMDHGEDEVLAISEKVVLRVEDLITWITLDAEWTWGRLGKCDSEVDSQQNQQDEGKTQFTDCCLDLSDVDNEKRLLGESKADKGPTVIILSYPRYCRYRAMMKRLEGVENDYLKHKLVSALGGFTVTSKNTRVLFCRETFDYPDLEGHELLCNHLAPKLKGRPRGRRKKRSVSPGSESNESECSISNAPSTSKTKITTEGGRIGLRCDTTSPRRSTRSMENGESKVFMRKLHAFMKSNHTPIGRIPHCGYKELDLYAFYTKVQRIGGYEAVMTNRLWKSIFDELSGNHNSTSAATVIRRHYERFLLPYERHMKGEEYKPMSVTERRRLKSKNNSTSDAETSESTSESGRSSPVPSTSTAGFTIPVTPVDNKGFNSHVKTEGKTSSLRSVRVKSERMKEKPPEKPDNEPPAVKLEPPPEESDVKPPAISLNNKPVPTKDTEPLTSAVAPVAQKVVPEKSLSPTECKEEGAVLKTEEAASGGKENVDGDDEDDDDVVEVPYKPQVKPEEESKSDTAVMQEVKRGKLDILKEGGLEVTPVVSKDVRPSVIQQVAAPKTLCSDAQYMPPPPSNTVPIRRQNQSLAKAAPQPSLTYLNGQLPPKVVQSKSIYSYSEKTVYGNPKAVPMVNPVHSPRVGVRQTGGDVLDLRVTSPQKPVVEIMRVPTATSLPQSFKPPPPPPLPLIEGRKIGSNLEITLVGPQNVKSPYSVHTKYTPANNYSANKKYPHKRTLSDSYTNSKYTRLEENGKSMRGSLMGPPSNGLEITAPNPYMKSHPSNPHMKAPNLPPTSSKQYSSTTVPRPSPMLTNYLPLLQSANKTVPPFMPVMDPLYLSALQSMYAPSPVGVGPPPHLFPMATPEQLQLYSEFMAQNARARYPFPFPDTNPSVGAENKKL